MLTITGVAFYQEAPEKRTIFQYKDQKLMEAMVQVKRQSRAKSVAILSTCDRIELYAEDAKGDLLEPFLRALGIPVLAWKIHAYAYREEEAEEYLFQLAAGLHSPLFGEETIISQMEHASLLCRMAGCSSPYLQTIMGYAVSSAKKIHAFCKMDLPEKELPPAPKRMLVIGSSSTARSVATFFQGRGWDVTMTLRDERKTELVPVGVHAIAYERRYGLIATYPVIVSATKGLGYALEEDAPLGSGQLVFDLARPYDVAPSLSRKCTLVFEETLSYERKSRIGAVRQSLQVIKEKKEAFHAWLKRSEEWEKDKSLCEHAAQELLYRLHGPLKELKLDEQQLASFSVQIADLAYKSFIHELFRKEKGRVRDLTQPLLSIKPLYEGDPPIRIEGFNSEGIHLTHIDLGSHSGTHMDVPKHVFPEGKSLEAYALDRFQGDAMVLKLDAHLSPIQGCSIILFATGWDEKYPDNGYMRGYPTLTKEQIEMLIQSGVKMVGFDCPSPDAEGSLDNHRLLLANDILIIENLTGLSALAGKRIELTVLPLSIPGSDGSPVRVVARS